MAAATGHATDRVGGVEQQGESQTLRYVYNAGFGMVFTMYIQGNNISISSSFPKSSDNYRIIYTFKEGNKQFLQLAEGTVMTIDGDRLLWCRAVYTLDNNPVYYRSTVKYQYF
jgi:hypothetical protein